MTAQAGLGDVMGQANLKGRMGVNMASRAAFQSEVILVGIVTLAAEWNDPDIFRWVSFMAISAESPVCLTLDIESKHNIFMTLKAVTYIDCGFNIFFVLASLCLKVCDWDTKQTEANKTRCKVENFFHNQPWDYFKPMIVGRNMAQGNFFPQPALGSITPVRVTMVTALCVKTVLYVPPQSMVWST